MTFLRLLGDLVGDLLDDFSRTSGLGSLIFPSPPPSHPPTPTPTPPPPSPTPYSCSDSDSYLHTLFVHEPVHTCLLLDFEIPISPVYD